MIPMILALPYVTAFQFTYSPQGCAYRAVVHNQRHEAAMQRGETPEQFLQRVYKKLEGLCQTRIKVIQK